MKLVDALALCSVIAQLFSSNPQPPFALKVAKLYLLKGKKESLSTLCDCHLVITFKKTAKIEN